MKASINLPVQKLMEVVTLLCDEETLNLVGFSEQKESDVTIEISKKAMVLSAEIQCGCSSQKASHIIFNIRTLCIDSQCPSKSCKNLADINHVLALKSEKSDNEQNPNICLEYNEKSNILDNNIVSYLDTTSCMEESSDGEDNGPLESQYLDDGNISLNNESTPESKPELETIELENLEGKTSVVLQNKNNVKRKLKKTGKTRSGQSSLKKGKGASTRASKRRVNNDSIKIEEDSTDDLDENQGPAREGSGEPSPKRKYNKVKKKDSEPSLLSKTQVVRPKSAVTVGRFHCKICNTNYVKEIERENHVLRTHKMTLDVYDHLTEEEVKQEAEVIRKRNHEKKEEKKKHKEMKSKTKIRVPKKYPAIQCNLCPYKASLKWLLSHIHKEHQDHPHYKKELCALDQQRKNMRKIKNTRICVTCPFCLLEFYGSLVIPHMKTFHKDDKEFQEKFELTYKEVKVLQQKIIYKKPDMPSVCDQCGREFRRKGDLNRHVRLQCKFTANKPEVYKCKYCNYYTTEAFCLENHMQKRHSKGQEDFICDFCGAKFNRQVNLTAHIRFKHTDCCWTCEKCAKVFDKKGTFNDHVVRCQSEVRMHSCEECPGTFKVKADLKKHITIVHRKFYRYRCEKCNHGVSNKSYLLTHKCGRVRRKDPNELHVVEKLPKKKKMPSVDFHNTIDIQLQSIHPVYNAEFVPKANSSEQNEQLVSVITTPDILFKKEMQQNESFIP